MSDTFDHEGDALDALTTGQGEDPPHDVACRRCGKRGLEWIGYGSDWHLCFRDPLGMPRFHRCVAKPSDFEVLP